MTLIVRFLSVRSRHHALVLRGDIFHVHVSYLCVLCIISGRRDPYYIAYKPLRAPRVSDVA